MQEIAGNGEVRELMERAIWTRYKSPYTLLAANMPACHEAINRSGIPEDMKNRIRDVLEGRVVPPQS